MRGWTTAALLAAALAGCIDQSKPITINLNITGHLDLVIHDARQDLEKITGEKATNVVKPEDIGLPPSQNGAAAPAEDVTLASGETQERFVPVLLRTARAAEGREPGRLYAVATSDDLKKTMAARSNAVRTLWDDRLVGEGHDGMLAAKGKLTPEQQSVVEAENADRAALYAAEAKAKSTTVDETALGYYVARLGYAKKGAWYEKYNATSKAWEWKQWGQ